MTQNERYEAAVKKSCIIQMLAQKLGWSEGLELKYAYRYMLSYSRHAQAGLHRASPKPPAPGASYPQEPLRKQDSGTPSLLGTAHTGFFQQSPFWRYGLHHSQSVPEGSRKPGIR